MSITFPEGRGKDHYDHVVAFAKERGLYEKLKERLSYLDTYAKGSGAVTQCILFKDFAPYSFEFEMRRAYRTHECPTCHKKWDVDVTLAGATPNISGEPTTRCEECQAKTYASPWLWRRWFNGGLVYFGTGDTGVDKQFTVRVGDTSEGWSIHT